ALQSKADYAPALLARGRLELSQGKVSEACNDLSRATAQNPLPEYQWALSEALKAAHRNEEAIAIEVQLEKQGSITDPRTFSLYLSTRGQNRELALSLAREEQRARSDVFTLDALAWSLLSSGNLSEAKSFAMQSISEGTIDARRLYHAGVIAARAGERRQAHDLLERAYRIRQMLLPSERERLTQSIADL